MIIINRFIFQQRVQTKYHFNFHFNFKQIIHHITHLYFFFWKFSFLCLFSVVISFSTFSLFLGNKTFSIMICLSVFLHCQMCLFYLQSSLEKLLPPDDHLFIYIHLFICFKSYLVWNYLSIQCKVGTQLFLRKSHCEGPMLVTEDNKSAMNSAYFALLLASEDLPQASMCLVYRPRFLEQEEQLSSSGNRV